MLQVINIFKQYVLPLNKAVLMNSKRAQSSVILKVFPKPEDKSNLPHYASLRLSKSEEDRQKEQEQVDDEIMKNIYRQRFESSNEDDVEEKLEEEVV